MTNPFAQFNVPASPFAPAGSQPPAGANPFSAPPQTSGFAQPGMFGAPPAFGPQPGMFAGMGQGAPTHSSDGGDPLPIGGHEEVEIGEITAKPSQKPGKQHEIWLNIELIVVKSSNAPVGTRGKMIEQLTAFNKPEHRVAAFARIRGLVAGALGQNAEDAAVKAQFDAQGEQIMSGVLQGAIKGKRLTVLDVRHTIGKPRVNPLNNQPLPPRVYSTCLCGPLGSPISAATPTATASATQATPFQGGPVWPPTGWVASSQPGFFVGTVAGVQHLVSEQDLRTAQAAGKV